VCFLEASDESLIRRFSETRHRHPLDKGAGIAASIQSEREMLSDVRADAHEVIDTTNLSARQLRERIQSSLRVGREPETICLNVMSSGYKYGAPPESDIVFDVRFMENPFYNPKLRDKDGRDSEVRDFVLSHPATKEFLEHLVPFLRFALPRYEEEKKARISIALGCTGGRHRSVVIADELAKRLRDLWPGEITVEHRDVGRAEVRT
jgi:UPF0042 nucleotide-binding protein